MRRGEKIVYTYGVFDLFHSGHVALLEEAKALGDMLIVGVFTDEVATKFKREPVIPFKHRKAIIEAIKCVDQVVAQDALPPDKNLKKIKPHILAKGPGAGWGEGSKKIPGEKTMKELGGMVIVMDYHDGISTSQIIKKIKEMSPPLIG